MTERTLAGSVERIRDHWRSGMTWRQPRPLVPEYELRRGAHRFAELEFPFGWRLQARARAFDRTWTFDQKGFWRRTATMTDARTGREVLELRLPVWRRSTLSTPQGRTYTGKAGLAQFVLEDEDGSILVRFPFKIRLVRFEADVELTERAADLLELPDLVVAAWFLAVMGSQHAAIAAAGTSAAAAGSG